MKKYFVQINRNMVVSIEAGSALGAEHAFLDLDGIQYANAFDTEEMKTETFRGAMIGCNTMSLDEIVQLSGNYRQAWQNVAVAKDKMNTARYEVERIEEMLREAKADEAKFVREYNECYKIAKETSNALNIEDC